MKHALLCLVLVACVRNTVLGTILPPATQEEIAGTTGASGESGVTGDSGPPACVPQAERCNGVDDSCDAAIDEGCDDDGDGACDGALVRETGATCAPSDCDDDGTYAALKTPGTTEICDNGIDDDCNGFFDEQEPSGACAITLLHRAQPLSATKRVSHAAPFVFDVSIAPADSVPPRAWSVVSATGGVTCLASDLEDAGGAVDTPSRFSRALRLTPAVRNDPARMGCNYEIEVTVGTRASTRFTITYANDSPITVPVARPVGAGYELWVDATVGALIGANTSEPESDTPFTFRWIDTSGLTTCTPFCELVDPAQASLALTGPLTPGDYVLTLETRDAVSTTAQHSVAFLVHVIDCVWASAGGTGTQDGSSPANAFSTLAAAIAQAAGAGRGVCIAGNGTFSEDLTLPVGLMLVHGGFDLAGATSPFRPTVSGVITAAPSSSAILRTLILQSPAAATATITVSAANLVIDDTIVNAPTTAASSAIIANSNALVDVTNSTIQVSGPADARVVRADAATVTLRHTGLEVSPCTGHCSVFATTGAATLTLRDTWMQVDADDVTVVEVESGHPTLTLTDALLWQVSAAATGRLVHAPNGANVTMSNNQTLNLFAGDAAIGVAIGGTGAIDISGNNIATYADGSAAIVVDLDGVAAQIHHNLSLNAAASYIGATPALAAAAIRLHATHGVHITNNDSIAARRAGSRYGAGIMDGMVDRFGVRTPGTSTDLRIVDNGAIYGGDGLVPPAAQDCSLSTAPESSDVAAGIVLVGSIAPVIIGNGRPHRDGNGIVGGQTLPYWTAGPRTLEPIATALWLVDTQGAIVERNELRDGVIAAPPDLACDPPPIATPLALRTDDAFATTLRKNGIDAVRLSGTITLENNFTSSVHVAEGTATLVHNFIDGSITNDATADVIANTVAGDVANVRTLWGNVISGAFGTGDHNVQGAHGYLEFATVWERSLARLLATSLALDVAPRAAIFANDDIDGDLRADPRPDAGPDELHRVP